MEKILLPEDGNYIVTTSASLFGNKGEENIVIASTAEEVKIDNSIEKVTFLEDINRFKFKQRGSNLEVYNLDGDLVIDIPLQEDNIKLLQFSNGKTLPVTFDSKNEVVKLGEVEILNSELSDIELKDSNLINLKDIYESPLDNKEYQEEIKVVELELQDGYNYILSGKDSELFILDIDSKEIRLKDEETLDFEKKSQYELSIIAVDREDNIAEVKEIYLNIDLNSNSEEEQFKNAPSSNSNEIETLTSGDNWKKDIVTFSFNESIPQSYYDYEKKSGISLTDNFTPLTDEQKDTVRDIFDELEEKLNIEFQEVEGQNGDIRFSMIDIEDDEVSGFSFNPPNENGDSDYMGDIFLSREFVDPNSEYDYSLDKDGYGRGIIEHEIGHALGLKHPFDGEKTLPEDRDYQAYTVMSYNEKYSYRLEYIEEDDGLSYTIDSVQPENYSLYDIEALQSIYGENKISTNQDNIYKIDFNNSNFHTIWDSGGIDTIDASEAKGSTTLDLKGGTLNSVDEYSLEQLVNHYQDGVEDNYYYEWIEETVRDYYNQNILYTGRDNFGIASGTVIENVITGEGNDTIFDNSANNSIITQQGDDNIFIGAGGFDTIDGGEGIDYIHINSLYSDINLEKLDENSFYLNTLDGYSANLTNIEYIIDINGDEYLLT
jgi:hypothetical protein